MKRWGRRAFLLPDASTGEDDSTLYHTDQVGTTRLKPNTDGCPVWQGTFLPFGEEMNPQATVSSVKFTGKQWDAETGLDYFGARCYTGGSEGGVGLGRFMTPDWSAQAEPVPYAKLDNPQSLNLYSYVLNNPVSLTDADGHFVGPGQGADGTFVTYDWVRMETGNGPPFVVPREGLIGTGGIHCWCVGSEGVGHHFLPREIFTKMTDKGTEAYDFWEHWTTGPLSKLGQAINRRTHAHRAYTEEAKTRLDEFLEQKGKALEDLSEEQRIELQKIIANAEEGPIQSFLKSLGEASAGALDGLSEFLDQLQMPVLLPKSVMSGVIPGKCQLAPCQF